MKTSFALIAATLIVVTPGQGQSLSVGDEVIFSGGPGQPPRSVQTGFTLNVDKVRSSGGSGLSGAGRPRPLDDGRDIQGPGFRGSDCIVDPSTLPLDSPARQRDFTSLGLTALEGELFDSSSLESRYSAAKELGTRQDSKHRKQAGDLLLAGLQDNDPQVLARCCRSLADLGEPRAVPPLLELLNQHDTTLLKSVIRALGDLRDPRAIPALAPFASGSGDALDQVAGQALAKIRSRGTTREKPKSPWPGSSR